MEQRICKYGRRIWAQETHRVMQHAHLNANCSPGHHLIIIMTSWQLLHLSTSMCISGIQKTRERSSYH